MKVIAPLLALLVSCAANAEDVSASDESSRVSRVIRDAHYLEDVPFSWVIEAATGNRAIPITPEKHKVTVAKLKEILNQVLERLSDAKHPIHSVERINEASRFIENELLDALNQVAHWRCSIPLTTEGNSQRSGYPDLFLQTPEGEFYLDPKLYSEESEESSLRTFYFEPRVTTNKIQTDAVHLLIGIMHSGRDDGRIRLVEWSIVDLAQIKLRLKAEFQASNRELYSANSTIATSKPDPGVNGE